MIDVTAPFADRTVFRVGYGAMPLQGLHDRRGEAVALLRRAAERGVDGVDTRPGCPSARVRQNVAVVHDIALPPGELPTLEPSILYHYTDPGGLQRIIERQCLWASNVWFMNDAREAATASTLSSEP
jgi:hypothetical protein